MRLFSLLTKAKTFWSIVGPFKVSAIVLFCVVIVAAFTETLGLSMVLPLLGSVIELGNDAQTYTTYSIPFMDIFPKHYHLLIICIITISLFIIKNLFGVLKAYFSSRLVTAFRKYWATGIMRSYLFSDFASLQKHKQGILLNNMVYEPIWASNCIKDMIDLFAKCATAFFIIALLALVNWRITLTISCVFAFAGFALAKVSQVYSLAVGKKKVRLSQQISAIAAESISGVRQIKIFSMENRIVKELSDRLSQLRKLLVKFSVIKSLPKAIGEMIIVILMMGIILFYFYIEEARFISIMPVLGLFVVCAQRLFQNLSTLFSQRMLIISYLPSLILVHELIKSGSSRHDTEGRQSFEELKNGILFEDVVFSYTNGEPLFEGLNLEFRKGSVTAMAGPSGSGKSTICDLLIGFFNPSSGGIYIDGRNINTLDLYSWRHIVGYVSQDCFLFNTTVRENILIGKPGAGDQEVITAATMAGIHEFIESLPAKYDTVIGDSGVGLSGGQRQRIAIARALVRNPEILIFDEATSSLDAESEMYVLKTIKNFLQKKTVIIITHRLTSLWIADQIHVLDKGKVVESGKYEQLIENKGLFWKLERLFRKEAEQSAITSKDETAAIKQ